MFPPERRGRPISVYLLGQAIAPGIGLFITSLVLSAAPTGAFDGIPILSSLAPWRIVFFLCGAIGLVVAALLLLYREPPRRDVRPAQGAGRIGEAFVYLRRNWVLFLPRPAERRGGKGGV